MDSAVFLMQAVIDQRRRDREADAAAHRRIRDGCRPDEASGRRFTPSRRRRSRPVPVVAVTTAPEPAGDDLELVGVGDQH